MQKTRMIVDTFDDLDLTGYQREKPAEVEATRSHRITLDGYEVEIDLSEQHSKELTEFLEPFLGAGRVFRNTRNRNRPTQRGAAIQRNKAVRAYAAARNIPLPQHRADYKTVAFKQVAQMYDEEVARGTAPASH